MKTSTWPCGLCTMQRLMTYLAFAVTIDSIWKWSVIYGGWSGNVGFAVFLDIIHNPDKIWANTWDFGTYRFVEQRRLMRACANAQTRQSLHRLYTQSMDVDEDSDQNQASSTIGYDSMGVIICDQVLYSCPTTNEHVPPPLYRSIHSIDLFLDSYDILSMHPLPIVYIVNQVKGYFHFRFCWKSQ